MNPLKFKIDAGLHTYMYGRMHMYVLWIHGVYVFFFVRSPARESRGSPVPGPAPGPGERGMAELSGPEKKTRAGVNSWVYV